MTDWIDHERALAGMPPKSRAGITLTGVGGHFSAAHYGPEGDLHGHTWTVKAWFKTPERADARLYKAALEGLLKSWDHKLLPPELAWAEDIAYAVGRLTNCVEVEVSRDVEGYYARWVL